VWLLAVFVGVLAAGAFYQAVFTARQRRLFPPPGSLIDVGGHRLHAHCAGAGSPPVLLESGIAASSLSWAAVQPEIAAFTRVCAYDRAGLAWSEAPSSPRTFDRLLDELGVVMREVGFTDPAVLVGHSFGSLLVRAYAARHPERVAGLVLVDPPIEWTVMTPARTRMLRGGRSLSWIGALLAHVGVVRACLALLSGGAPGAPRRFVKIFGPTAARTLERLVSEVRKLPPEVHPVVQALWCQPKCFYAMGDHLLMFEREAAQMMALAPPPQLPVVVVSSGNLTSEQRAAHRRLAESSARGRHVIASRSAHWIQFDEPGLIVGIVGEMVESIRSPA
jgi:pimeloyl-ACP methyl ester carboxylesterase